MGNRMQFAIRIRLRSAAAAHGAAVVRISLFLILVLLAFAAIAPAGAVQPDEMLPDPKLEQRARNLSRELRCMVCQNQSIDDSEAPLARDLRILVRERLKAGNTDAQVLDFLTARYGEFVLLKPPLAWHTALLWLAPAGVLVVGIVALAIARRRRQTGVPSEPPLTAAEQERLAALVGTTGGEPS